MQTTIFIYQLQLNITTYGFFPTHPTPITNKNNQPSEPHNSHYTSIAVAFTISSNTNNKF